MDDGVFDGGGAAILITGASGFLGGAIAAELLHRAPSADLLFLVRARDVRSGLQKLRNSVARFEVSSQALSRLTEANVLCGDLQTSASLLSDVRAQRITHVVNCAALVSFARKPEVRTTNVDDTLAFARAVAQLPALRRFLHVSTAMVCGAAMNQVVYEDNCPGGAPHFTVYTRSKAEAERQLAGVLDGCLTIARPSIIVGHTRLGCLPSPSIFWLFRMIHAARRVPFSRRTRIDVVPVDYCATALVDLLAQSGALPHARYHISAGPQASCSFEEIDAAMSRATGTATRGELQEFDIADLPALEPEFERWFGPCDPKRTAYAIRAYCAYAGLNVTFDNSRLRDAGIPAPPAVTQYVDGCVRTSATTRIAQQMESDAR